MAYAILRTAKLKSFGEIGGSLAHTFRERETHNADPALTSSNQHWGASAAAEALMRIKEVLPAKYRSDAVLCIEYFVGRSPDWAGSDDRYLGAALKWLLDRHGPENVVSAHVHKDEKTPHMVAYVVPRDGDRLNAKKWLGGRKTLSEMQTAFWQEVGRLHGLERGIEGSVARHQTVKEYYSAITRAADVGRDVSFPKERQVLEKGLITTTLESDGAFAERVAGAVLEQMRPAAQASVEAVHLARREREQAREIGRLNKALVAAQKRWEPIERAFDGLTANQVGELIQALQGAADRMRAAARDVVGWLRCLGTSRFNDRWEVTLEEQSTGRTITLQAYQAALDLDRAKAQPGDLVRVSASAGEILARRPSRGLEK